jgi:multidrug efflux system outer membrane protein
VEQNALAHDRLVPARVPPRPAQPPPGLRRHRRGAPLRSRHLLLAGILAGCAVGPSYTRPIIPTPTRWRLESDTSASIADVAWWRVFQDTVLRGLIRTALAENLDLSLAIARVRESRAQFVATRGRQFPQVNGLAARVDARFPSVIPLAPGARQQIGTTTIGFFTTGLDASYEVDVWGRLGQMTKAAHAEYEASASDRQAVITTLIGDVAQSYFELLRLDRVAVVTRETVETRRASLALVRRRLVAGLTSEIDVRRAEQELAAVRAQLPGVARQIAETENRLSILLGRNPAPVPRGMVLGAQAVPPRVPAGLPSTLLERRPDIRAAELRVVAANARSRSALAELFPRISLTGLLGTQSRELSKLFGDESGTRALVSLVRVPIFHGGTLRGNLEAARAREAEAAITYERAVLQAFREVNDALAYRSAARDTRASIETQVVAARRALQLANLRYVEGLGTYLDVLDAERQLTSAEIDLASAVADQLQAVVQLYKALGGGWDVTAPERRDPP